MLWKGRTYACLPAVPWRVVCDAGCPNLFPKQGTIKEDHVRVASVSGGLRYSFLQSNSLVDKSSRVLILLGLELVKGLVHFKNKHILIIYWLLCHPRCSCLYFFSEKECGDQWINGDQQFEGSNCSFNAASKDSTQFQPYLSKQSVIF